MRNQEGVASIRQVLFSRSILIFWKGRIRSYLQSLGAGVWGIIEGGYQHPSPIPINEVEKKKYETNENFVNAMLGILEESEFVEVMKLNTESAIWDKIIQVYEGGTKAKSFKLQRLRIQDETLIMPIDESIASFFLEVDVTFISMSNIGDKIKEPSMVERILISLTLKFDSKVSTIEDM